MDYHLLAREILDLVGGPDNIASFTNCMTRLRLNLIRPETADAEAINGLAGVLGVVEGKELQVVVGPGHAVGGLYSCHRHRRDDSSHAAWHRKARCGLCSGRNRAEFSPGR